MAPGGGEPRPGRPSGSPSLINLGTTLFGCVVLGLAGGYFADRWLGTTPWLILVGLAFGIAAAVINFIRALRALDRAGSEQ